MCPDSRGGKLHVGVKSSGGGDQGLGGLFEASHR